MTRSAAVWIAVGSLISVGASAADEPTASERRHVAPDPPTHVMHAMSEEQMIELMEMDDAAAFGSVMVDELEWAKTTDDDKLGWDLDAWYGGDYDKLWIKSEGERVAGEAESRNEFLWDRIVSRWWHLQAGARIDDGRGPTRTWAAVGFEGLAPQWIDVEATLYLGNAGRTALRFEANYDLLLTQRWVLRPKLELNAYGKDDRRNEIGAGLADTELALRLRYEIRRELAPYVGLAWQRSYGATADFVRAAGEDRSELEFLIGVYGWW